MAAARNTATDSQTSHSRDEISRMLSALTRWFEANARDLPWRQRRDGYTALVSEAMLQQTQVSRVIDRYTAFMDRFPTIHDLAAADEQEVLALWQGLGYYRRASHLHAAAKCLVKNHHGRVPACPEQLMELPGIGRYTAGAIASIVYDQRVPIVDGNIERVIARWHGQRREGNDQKMRAWTWTRAEEIAAVAHRPGVVNEALMELGALVCTPRNPSCETCPVAKWCRAQREHSQHETPGPKQAARQKSVHHHAVIIRRGERILLEQRPLHGLWSQMWQTPTIESARPLRPGVIRQKMPVTINQLARLARFEHQTTHLRITFHIFTARSRARSGMWRSPEEIADLPLSAPQHRIMRMAIESQGNRSLPLGT